MRGNIPMIKSNKIYRKVSEREKIAVSVFMDLKHWLVFGSLLEQSDLFA